MGVLRQSHPETDFLYVHSAEAMMRTGRRIRKYKWVEYESYK